ncbi:hypothetical protein CYMTET_50622 [Cymbomonas tetramitiformis]|uniref:Uncharacterized protein n=1 Tax=Cymbomonas tetramitiformis TaxID=36881 RepID=A0AAE0ESM4_9CHLO|nr:hypothetical protein CYMTET_50622 [Cymbomonas tetramitiformis]
MFVGDLRSLLHVASVVWFLAFQVFVRCSIAGTLSESHAYRNCCEATNTCGQLDLASSSLTSSIPTEIATCTALTDLRLGTNLLGGKIPTELVGLTSLVLL